MSLDVRARAACVLGKVITEGRSLADILPPELDSFADPRQRALLQELVYGTLRWYYRLEGLLGQLLRKPLKRKDNDLRCLLLAGLYQLDQLSMPQRVAVNETVQAVHALNKGWASGLVNAVLRNFQRDPEKYTSVIVGDAQACHAHPAWLIEKLQSDWPDHWTEIIAANNERPPFSLRTNARRTTRDDYLSILEDASIPARPLLHAPQGIVLERPLPVSELPGFSEGTVSVQDGGAQLAAGLLQLEPGQRVLDACAAPGGKTVHILESCTELAGVTAIDKEAVRLQRVTENLARAELHAEIIAADAAVPETWWDGRPYDRILLDAPCSATGVIRRHPDIKLLRKPEDIKALAVVQSNLLQALWPLLAPDGMLLYCTCSVLAEENSVQVERFLASCPDAVERPVDAAWGHACSHGRQLLPGEYDMDGFYFACLQKPH